MWTPDGYGPALDQNLLSVGKLDIDNVMLDTATSAHSPVKQHITATANKSMKRLF